MSPIQNIDNINKVLCSVDKKASDLLRILNKLNTNGDDLIYLRKFLSNSLSMINQYSDQLKSLLKVQLKNAEKQERFVNLINNTQSDKTANDLQIITSSKIISEQTYIDANGTLSNLR